MYIEFCLPVYNEEKILRDNALKTLNFCQTQNWDFDWQIFILVNGSTDRTEAIAKELGDLSPKISVKIFDRQGKGYALRQHFLSSQADIIAYMDIDLAVSLNDLPNLINPIISKECDLAIGSRLLPESRIDRSLLRELSSQGYNLLSRLILRHRFSDLQCGFKAMTKSTFDQLKNYAENGFWFFDTELVIFAKHLGLRIKEIPVDWQENRYKKRHTRVKLLHDSLDFICRLWRLHRRLKQVRSASANKSVHNDAI